MKKLKVSFTPANGLNGEITYMNDKASNPERGWWTYVKGILFLIPPVGAWGMLQVFCIPKLKQICADAGVFPGQPLFHATDFVFDHVAVISAVVILCLVALEWESRKWREYRRAVLGVFIFLVNS